jgi:hypothetical protein
MQFNPSPTVRLALYVLFSIGGLVVAYLVKKDSISTDEVALYTAVTSFVFGLAGINTK